MHLLATICEGGIGAPSSMSGGMTGGMPGGMLGMGGMPGTGFTTLKD